MNTNEITSIIAKFANNDECIHFDNFCDFIYNFATEELDQFFYEDVDYVLVEFPSGAIQKFDPMNLPIEEWMRDESAEITEYFDEQRFNKRAA